MKSLGKYEILEVLGSGSMGTVYRAHDTVIDRDIALKTIRTGIETEPEMRERFYREARSCGRLQHPNIITIYDLGEEAKTAFIAMELLKGFDFRKLIDQGREIPVARKLEWMAQICDALGHAHQHGVIHRDVKPSNLFLTEAGAVKVLDFGIARLTSSRLTVAGNILGTPNYMAPEQILANACDGRADLFSAGVVFFELLVYKHPFRGPMIPQRIVEGEPDSLFDHQSNLPPILEKVFARALAKNPDERYPNAASFATDLRAILDTMRTTSPALSQLDLPSNRTETIAPPMLLASVEPARAPAGEDTAEWRNSEMLMLVPEFEYAVEQKNQAHALRIYDTLLRVAGSDGRFAEAIANCRARLEQLGAVPVDMAGTVAITDPALLGARAPSPAEAPQSQRICLECGASNRSAARFCIGCGANLDDATLNLASPAPVVAESSPLPNEHQAVLSETVFDRTTIYTPDRESAAPIDSKADPTPKIAASKNAKAVPSGSAPWVRAYGRYVIAAAVALLVVIVVIGFMLKSSPPPPMERAVATATSSVPNLNVYAEENTGSKKLYTLRQGEGLNILKLPESPAQEWIKVQSVANGNTKAAGFARRSDIASMAGSDAVSSLALARLLPSSREGEAVSSDKLQALNALAAKYPGTPEAAEALAEVAKLQAPAVPVTPVPDPKSEADSAKFLEIQQLVKDRKYPDADAALQAFLLENPDNEQAKQLLIVVQHARRVNRLRTAEKLFADGKYDEAEKIVSGVHEEEPDNKAAKQLLDKIRVFRDALRK